MVRVLEEWEQCRIAQRISKSSAYFGATPAALARNSHADMPLLRPPEGRQQPTIRWSRPRRHDRERPASHHADEVQPGSPAGYPPRSRGGGAGLDNDHIDLTPGNGTKDRRQPWPRLCRSEIEISSPDRGDNDSDQSAGTAHSSRRLTHGPPQSAASVSGIWPRPRNSVAMRWRASSVYSGLMSMLIAV